MIVITISLTHSTRAKIRKKEQTSKLLKRDHFRILRGAWNSVYDSTRLQCDSAVLFSVLGFCPGAESSSHHRRRASKIGENYTCQQGLFFTCFLAYQIHYQKCSIARQELSNPLEFYPGLHVILGGLLFPAPYQRNVMVFLQGDEDTTRWTIFDPLTEDEIMEVVDFLVDDMGFFHERGEFHEREVSQGMLCIIFGLSI